MIDWTATKYNAILCLSGGHIPSTMIRNYYSTYPLIATDGAANYLKKHNIPISIIIGDLDSIDRKITLNEKIVHIKDQNTTDFEKALLYIEEHHLSPTLIFGMQGGEIDHALNNFHCLAKFSKRLTLVFCDEEKENSCKYGKLIFDQIAISDRKGHKISILPYPMCVVSTSGLRWQLNCSRLAIAEKTSARNEIISEYATIRIHEGSALVIA